MFRFYGRYTRDEFTGLLVNSEIHNFYTSLVKVLMTEDNFYPEIMDILRDKWSGHLMYGPLMTLTHAFERFGRSPEC